MTREENTTEDVTADDIDSCTQTCEPSTPLGSADALYVE